MPTLKRSLQLAKANHHRVLLLLAENNDLAPLKPSDAALENSTRDVSDQINDLLGSETDCLIFDARQIFDERLFAASAGTLLSGGILVLLTPALTEWAKLQSNSSAVESLFLLRFIRKIQTHTTLELENIDLPSALKELEQLQDVPHDTKALLIADTEQNTACDDDFKNAWQSEQKKLIDIVLSNLNKPCASTIVVQAKRGRGKSALIGQAVKRFLAQNHESPKMITVTSNRRRACNILLDHATANSRTNTDTIGMDNIQYLPLDQAISMQHDLLIVEEAGSISLPMLSRLTRLSDNIIFATTVQGYEGAGRGFALRFSKQLDIVRPDWIKLEPMEPIRWAKSDPLEAFVNDALLLDTQLAHAPQAEQLFAGQTQLSLIDRHQLLIDDQLLDVIVSLLVQAHYQTTPADLRNFLDQENIQIFVQRVDDVVTGAALIALEGGIPTELHQAIVNKERRLADQILPQLLAQSASTSINLSMRYARVIRIAIHPERHRQGFGTELMNQLQQQLHAKIDVVGASFGADDQTLAFWLKLGYQPIHYGYKANARSGLRSACVLRANCNEVLKTIDTASNILNYNLKVAAEYELEPSAVIKQLINATTRGNFALTMELQAKLINDFCLSKRSFFDTCGYVHDALQANRDQLSHDKSKNKMFNCMQLLLDESTLATPKEKRAAEQALRAQLSTFSSPV